MFTKPKSTTKLPLAMLYKRYVAIESAFGKNSVYYVVDNLKRKYFIFDSVNEDFIEIREDEKGTAQEVQILYNRAFSYNDKYYKYNVATKKIEKKDNNDSLYVDIIKDSPNIGKYQLNKYYYASDSYAAEDLIDVDAEYSLYNTSFKLSKECYEAFLKMYNDAKEAGYGFKINSPYRSYQKQESLYSRYKQQDGEKLADTYSARPGYSEHQTGYAFDIRDYPYTNEDYSKTKSFTWVSENSYKYGFIIRFPKNKEDITGYQYESWHYRYCGIECSTYIHKTGITFEEYYEYFIKYKNPKNLS